VYSDHATRPRPVSALCWQIHRPLAVLVSPLRVWVHCPRASNGSLPPRSNLVGYVRWDGRSDRSSFQTINSNSFTRSQATQHIRLPFDDDAYEHSYILAILSSLAPLHLYASRCIVASRFRCQPCGCGYIVRGHRTDCCLPAPTS